jgi:hypothetical protein
MFLTSSGYNYSRGLIIIIDTYQYRSLTHIDMQILRSLKESIIRPPRAYRQLNPPPALWASALVGVLPPVFVYAAIDAAALEVDAYKRLWAAGAPPLTTVTLANIHTALSPLYI